ncbi:MAG: Ig-like domain-containing protein [Cyclobacteriaceae bacterium]|nr:Ig-like domain-containing protein [Cyclobacteriaceae bacterium HetDA_MAG_MS6]
MRKNLFILTTLLLGSCIGTDVVDDPLVPPRISTTPLMASILVDSAIQLNSTYYNQYGIEEEVVLSYINLSSGIISLDLNGSVTGNSIGVGRVVATYQDVVGDTIIINVLGSPDDVANVVISAPSNTVDVGATLTLDLMATNFMGESVTDAMVSWQSKDTQIATVNAMGIVTGVGNGVTEIVATADGIQSEAFEIIVGNVGKIATFSGNRGYGASGMATLNIENDSLKLNLSSDFDTDFAGGGSTVVYLSNTINDRDVVPTGLRVMKITEDGAYTFNITEIADPDMVGLDDYRYVIILCEPFEIIFGIADFES